LVLTLNCLGATKAAMKKKSAELQEDSRGELYNKRPIGSMKREYRILNVEYGEE
jgi:hypothetical protein